MSRILIVEDNAGLRAGISRALREAGHDAVEAPDGESALERLQEGSFDLVLTDMRMGEVSGLDVLRAARRANESTLVIVMTAYGTIQGAVEAMREGAYDFLQKPFDLAEIELKVTRALEHRRLDQQVQTFQEERQRWYVDRLIAPGPALQQVLQVVNKVASSNATVLITGETGTGKEMIAGALHYGGVRAKHPFVKVNCAAIPDTLLESELFGHEKGAFTGADRPRIGRFEQADRGTLFLDEIGDMSPGTQSKLLRVLQSKEFERLGGNRTIRVDVRIVAATHRDLPALVREGRFRDDLFYRLNVVSLRIPPLRERPDDIVPLAHHFLERYAAELKKRVKHLTLDAEALLRRHPWPGNVRELQNVMERMTLLVDGDAITARDLSAALGEAPMGPGALGSGVPPARNGAGAGAAAPAAPAQPPRERSLRLDELEREAILEALERSGWVQKDAAALLGISLRAMNYRVKALGIRHERWRRNR
ncbi:MAG TPA: sigma-54 dependent transcriptional regulator [Thermodesulfobacteriota bacterium]